MARHYKSQRSSAPNHHRDRHDDERKFERDVYPKDMYRHPLTRAELYAGMDPRMRTELEDSAMIHEDHRAIANLPQEVMIKPYPLVGTYIKEILNDDVSGVDAQMGYDDAQRERNFYPKKV